MKQSKAFLDGEGDAWFARNQEKMLANAGNDPIIKVLDEQQVRPKSVLEIGCSNGWRLAAMRERYICNAVGLEPSQAACRDALKRYPGTVNVLEGTATAPANTFSPAYFDLIVFGFCLYLVDREDLFTVVANSDRWLVDGGYIAILDFDEPWPHFKPYIYRSGIKSYHMNYADLWLANPAYGLVKKSLLGDEDDTAVTLIRKNMNWPEKP